MSALGHDAGCAAERSETFDIEGAHGSVHRTVRCLDCGASSTTLVVPAAVLMSGTEEYAQAWRLEPTRLRRQLTTEDELLDPLRNPLHPRAEPDAPVFEGSGRRVEPWPHFPPIEGR